MTASSRLIIFTRYPEPGHAKTRLIPKLGPDGAAQVHRRLTERMLGAARRTGLPFLVAVTGAEPAKFKDWLGAVDIVDQGDGELGERMLRAIGEGPSIIVGSDVPGITSAHLLRAAELLEHHDVVIGPAEDGGYWLVGMRRPLPELFDHMAWGSDTVLAETRARARRLGIDLVETDVLSDLDTPEDLARWPALMR